jgi:hypothetical protein
MPLNICSRRQKILPLSFKDPAVCQRHHVLRNILIGLDTLWCCSNLHLHVRMIRGKE